MLLQLLFYIFIIIGFIDIAHFGFYLVGANYYDMLQFKRAAHKAKRTYRRSTGVSVLIPAHNEEKAIVRCLDSVRRSTYRKLEIIVIDDASSDNTARLVRQYIKKHPKRNIKLLAKRKNVGKAEALNHALYKGVQGEFVMTLDADSVLERHSITNAVRYFDDPKIVGVAANVRVLDSFTMLGLLQKFEYMVGYRSKKFFSVTNSEFIVGGVASTYRYSTLKEVGFYDNDTLTEDIGLSLKVVAQGNRAQRIVYGVNVLAMTEGVQTFKALLRQRYRWKMGSLQSLLKYRHLIASTNKKYSPALTWYRLPMAFLGEAIVLLEPLAIGYVFYLSFQVLNLTMIIGAYLTITLYLLWNVWPDEHMKLASKLRLSSYTPIMYFVFYTMNVVQLVAVIRCLLNPSQIRRRTAQKSNWVSPERKGQTEVQFS